MPTNSERRDGNALLAIKQTKQYGSIRKLDDPGGLSAQLILIARQYSGVDQADKDTVKACIQMIRSQFGTLGLHEIRLAFQEWASGRYGEMKQAESYGKFTARHLGAVLNAYVEKTRKAALREYYAEQEAAEREAAEQERAEQRKEFDSQFPDMVRQAAGKDWQDIPAFWYDSAIRLGLMQEPDAKTKWDYMDRAKEAFMDELKDRPRLHDDPFRKFRDTFNLISDESQIKSIAMRMIVADKLLNPVIQSELDEDIPI